MRPRLHRVLAPAIFLVVTAAALPPALVVLAVCRRLPGAQAARSEARVSPLPLTVDPGTRRADLPVLPRAVPAPRGPAS